MESARYVGRVALRALGAAFMFYLAAFFTVIIGMALAIQLGYGHRLSVGEIFAIPAAVAILLGSIILAALLLRGVPFAMQVGLLAAYGLFVAGVSRPLWQDREGRDALFPLVLAALAIGGGYLAWAVMRSPLRAPRHVAAFGGVMVLAGMLVGAMVAWAA